MRLAVTPLQDVLNMLMRSHPALVPKEVAVYLRDVHDHVVRAARRSTPCARC
jgi:magnesium transporter